MRSTIALSCVALALSAAPALAEPCVSPTFDTPLAGATDVTSHIADVPSAQFPAFWQDGRIDGHRYRLFSNGEGSLRTANAGEDWSIEIACNTPAQTCDYVPNGAVPDPATQIAQRLGQCLLGAVPSDQGDAAPAPNDAAQPDAPQSDTNAPETDTQVACGLAVVREATDVATLQRLLTLAGTDPGPVDGFLGPQTFKALDTFVPDSNWGTSVPDAITVLDAVLCERAQ